VPRAMPRSYQDSWNIEELLLFDQGEGTAGVYNELRAHVPVSVPMRTKITSFSPLFKDSIPTRLSTFLLSLATDSEQTDCFLLPQRNIMINRLR
jgi:hypothetical protein